MQYAAFMWRRHRWAEIYSLLAFAVLVLVAALAGFDTWLTRVAVGVAGGAIAGSAATDYRVLAKTSDGLVLFRASKVRQYAVELQERLDAKTSLQRVGGTMLAAEWQVGQRSFSVAKSSEGSMAAIASD